MKRIQNNYQGFTIIELLAFILILVIIATVAIANVRGFRADNRDDVAKTDINATYYQLEAYFEKNGHYPKTINVDILKGIDPESLKDENNIAFNELGGRYTYKASNCSKDACTSFELSTKLEREATYTKLSLNK